MSTRGTATEMVAEADRRVALARAHEAVERAAREAVESLAAEINARYAGGSDVHPALRHKYERDMADVLALRAALAALDDVRRTGGEP